MNSEELRQYLKNADNWEKIDSGISGAKVVKVPATKYRDAVLMIEITPLSDAGEPIRKKGVFISNYAMLESFRMIMQDDRMQLLLKHMDTLNYAHRGGNG